MPDDDKSLRTGPVSVYFSIPLIKLCAGTRNRSARLRHVAERFREFMDLCTPELDEAQWCAICDVANGLWLQGDADPSRAILFDIEDAEGLGDKWGVDTDHLCNTLRDMHPSAMVAVVEVAQRYWDIHSSPELRSHRAILERAGARFPADSRRRTTS